MDADQERETRGFEARQHAVVGATNAHVRNHPERDRARER
jgi:hypothetical protein